MADRYWVGGTGSWTDTAKWSTSSGGSGGASVPTAADNVFFNSASNATDYTVNIDFTTAKECLNFTVAGPATGTVTFSSTAGTSALIINGNYSSASSGVTLNVPEINFVAATSVSNTVTVANSLGTITFGTVFRGAGTITLGGAFTSSRAATILMSTGGIFNTGGFSVTALSITIGSFSDTTNAYTVNLSSSTLTTNSNGQAWVVWPNPNLTFNAGTSTIILNADNIQFDGNSRTYYNVSFPGTAAVDSNHIINGNNTFNNLSFAGPSSASSRQILFYGRSTVINGTLSTSSTTGSRRVVLRSQYTGKPHLLTINSAPSLTDVDFQDVYVTGTAAPISGTRIGDRRGNSGITFSTPKTVYWNLAAGGNWGAVAWATSSGGTVSADNFPLPQDQAIIQNTGLNTSATITMPAGVNHHVGTLDASTRTNAMTLAIGSTTPFIYGDFKFSQTISQSGASIIFVGRRRQNLICTGTYTGNFNIDSPGGSVVLQGAVNCFGLNFLSGDFDTNGFTVSPAYLFNTVQNKIKIYLRNSTINLTTQTSTGTNTWIQFDDIKDYNTNVSNLELDAGTSTINIPSYTGTSNIARFNFGGHTWYNVNFAGTDRHDVEIYGNGSTFNNLTFSGPATTNLKRYILYANVINVTGTLTASMPSVIRRMSLFSSTQGTVRTINAGAVSLADVDFRDIAGAGTATWTGTRLGNCGGNINITFPAPKTVYWGTLSGTQDWAATAWATGSGGTPALNNFPLAQDTAVINNSSTLSALSTTTGPWNVGTLDMSARTTSCPVTIGGTSISAQWNFFGDFKLGSGVGTYTSNQSTILSGRSNTNVILTSGTSIAAGITINSYNGKYTLSDSITITGLNSLFITRGVFDASTFNVTIPGLSHSPADQTGRVTTGTYMGSGTWTLTGTGQVMTGSGPDYHFINKGSANIVVSDASTSTKTFTMAGCYNKLTLTGNAICAYNFLNAAHHFTEIASTKTTAFTINLAVSTVNPALSVGTWSITGTSGNLVTVQSLTAGTPAWLALGSVTSGIDYLSVKDIRVYNAAFASYANPQNFGQFFVGANSTNGGNNTDVTFTATPAARTLYWVGGTGNWSDANKWSTSSGGGGGSGPPNAHDNVVFDSASNATSYTVTIDTDVSRCNNFTMSGPATGTVTWAGTSTILKVAGNLNLSGGTAQINRTWTGALIFCGTGSRTINSNGVTLPNIVFNGAMIANATDATWTLTSALTTLTTSLIQVLCGKFDTAGFAVSCGYLRNEVTVNTTNPSTTKPVTLTLGASTVSLTSTTNNDSVPVLNFGSSNTAPSKQYYTLESNTSTITYTGGGYGNKYYFANCAYYNVAFSNQGAPISTHVLGFDTGVSFNNLTLEGTSGAGTYRYVLGPTSSFIENVTVTVNGTFTAQGRADLGNQRVRLFGGRSTDDIFFFPRRYNTTINAAAVSLRDADFCSITCGGAATWSGTRVGDAGGNIGLVPPTPRTLYVGVTNTSTYDYVWASVSGGTPSTNNYPLPQDTCIIDNSSSLPANTLSWFDSFPPLSIINTASRSSAFILNISTQSIICLKDFTLSSAVSVNGAGTLRMFGANTNQTITTSGVNLSNAEIWIHNLASNGYGYSVILGGALTSNTIYHSHGVFDTNSHSVTTRSYQGNYLYSNKRTFGNWSNSQYQQLILKNTNVTILGNNSVGNAITFENFNANTGLSDYGYTDISNATFTIANPTNSANVTLFMPGVKLGKLVLAGAGTGQRFNLTSFITRVGELASSRTSAYTLSVGNLMLEVDKFTATGSSGANLTIAATYVTNGPGLIRKRGAEVRGVDYITLDGVSLEGDTPKTWWLGNSSSITTGTWAGANVSSTGIFSTFVPQKQGTMGTFFH